MAAQWLLTAFYYMQPAGNVAPQHGYQKYCVILGDILEATSLDAVWELFS